MKKRRFLWSGAAIALIVGIVLNIGAVYTIDEWTTGYEIFLKHRPSLRYFYFDSYGSYPVGPESEYQVYKDANRDWTPGSPQLDDFLQYCHARFGIDIQDEIHARTACKQELGYS